LHGQLVLRVKNNPVKIVSQMIRHFFWKAAGCVPSLESLDASHGVVAKHDVTAAIGAPNSKEHPLTVAELAGGKIIANLRLVATEKDVVIGRLQCLHDCAEPQKHYLLYRSRFRVPKYRRGTALLLGHGVGGGYYHWLIDSLPRWGILRAAGYVNYDYVLLPDRLLPFEEETLDLLKIPQAKRLQCSKNFVHQFERLIVPAMPVPDLKVSAWVCKWLRSLYPVQHGGPEKIYLSRRNTSRRRLANEVELEAKLQAAGFVTIQAEQFPVVEQARLFSSAKCVVSCHGAGLANMVFAPLNALLVELFHPDIAIRPAFQYLAPAAGLRYAAVMGARTQESVPRREEEAEFKIDPSAVFRAIEENGNFA
jgi:glycosyl transferase family 61